MRVDPSVFAAPPALLRTLEPLTTPVRIDKERILFGPEDDTAGIYVVHAGTVTLSIRTHSGKERAAFQVPAGSLVGIPALLSGEPYSFTATAHPGAEVSYLTRHAFAGLMRDEPDLARKVLEILAAEARLARELLHRKRAD